MEMSLPLFCEEEEEPCRPVIHDVNNSLPPVVERGMDHEGMSRVGEGAEKDKQEILSLFVLSSCAESRGRSKLFASAESSRSAGCRVLLGLG